MKKPLLAVCITLLLISCGGSSGSNSGTNTAKYKIIYNDNGCTSGFAPVDNNEYTSGSPATVLDKNTLEKTGYTFDGWNTKADASGDKYNSGDTIEIKNTNIFLYAVWKSEN